MKNQKSLLKYNRVENMKNVSTFNKKNNLRKIQLYNFYSKYQDDFGTIVGL